MKLLTKAIEKQLPPFYSTEKIPLDEKKVICKFFTPMSSWTWYVIEYNPETREFFGIVCGHEQELGYFSLDELEGLTAMNGKLPLVERDRWFTPTLVKDLKKSGDLR